jgi:hypothetical protein
MRNIGVSWNLSECWLVIKHSLNSERCGEELHRQRLVAAEVQMTKVMDTSEK